MEDAPDLVVSLTVDTADADLAADRLWVAGATAVGEEEVAGAVTLTASFPTPAAAALVASEVGGRVVEVDPSWRHAWKVTAEPVEVGGLVVAPAWRDVAVGDGRLVLRIDSGGVFGSGTHPSTRLLLAALDATPPLGLDVLDVGCGSGILSVAAARLGASSVVAVDVDEEAVA
ncbi:MAG TPA: 50S ribosomal protein L11 methyltransferase, partial [Acidimicrobiales bacterium]|nr:50S ribosomal protein L11 methyltransferase [Acidimicrobiales bacterium]